MEFIKKHMILEEILDSWQDQLAEDALAYKNHCYRVLNFYSAFVAKTPDNLNKGAIAIAFHDLGIWSHHTFDYLAPSEELAREYLHSDHNACWTEEIVAMIANHHKVTAYRGYPSVEALRKADWLDVSRGALRFGLTKAFIQSVQETFPEEGFHRRLTELSAQHFNKNPLKPFPMFKW